MNDQSEQSGGDGPPADKQSAVSRGWGFFKAKSFKTKVAIVMAILVLVLVVVSMIGGGDDIIDAVSAPADQELTTTTGEVVPTETAKGQSDGWSFKTKSIIGLALLIFVCGVILFFIYYKWMMKKESMILVPRGYLSYIWIFALACTINWVFYTKYSMVTHHWIFWLGFFYVMITWATNMGFRSGVIVASILTALGCFIWVSELKGWDWFNTLWAFFTDIREPGFSKDGRFKMSLVLWAIFVGDYLFTPIRGYWYISLNACEFRRMFDETLTLNQSVLNQRTKYKDFFETVISGSKTVILTEGSKEHVIENVWGMIWRKKLLSKLFHQIGMRSQGPSQPK